MVLQTNLDSEFINKGHLGNVSDGGISVDKNSILIRGNISIVRNHGGPDSIIELRKNAANMLYHLSISIFRVQ